MVEILADHFDRHATAVFAEGVAARDGVDDRNFDRGEDARPIAHLHDDGILRIVRDAQEIAAHRTQQLDVAFVHLVGQGVAPLQVVLVAVRADELHVPVVEEEAAVGVEAVGAHAERREDLVAARVARQAGVDAIEIRILRIPAMHVVELGRLLDGVVLDRGREGQAAARACHDASFAVGDPLLEQHLRGSRGAVREAGFEGDAGAGPLDALRADIDAVGGVVGRGDVDGGGVDERNVAVDAAVEGVVGREGRDVGVVGVVHLDDEEVLARADELREVEREGGVAARVAADAAAVDVEDAPLVGAVEAERDALVGQQLFDAHAAAVPTLAAGVAGRLVVRVEGVPGVGDRDDLPARVVAVGGFAGFGGFIGFGSFAGRGVQREAPGVVDGRGDALGGGGRRCQQQRAESRKAESVHGAVFSGLSVRVYLCLREATEAPSTMHEKSHSGTSCRSLTTRRFVPARSGREMRRLSGA